MRRWIQILLVGLLLAPTFYVYAATCESQLKGPAWEASLWRQVMWSELAGPRGRHAKKMMRQLNSTMPNRISAFKEVFKKTYPALYPLINRFGRQHQYRAEQMGEQEIFLLQGLSNRGINLEIETDYVLFKGVFFTLEADQKRGLYRLLFFKREAAHEPLCRRYLMSSSEDFSKPFSTFRRLCTETLTLSARQPFIIHLD